MSTRKRSVSRGTRTTPPPRPVSAPRKPATKETAATTTVNSMTVIRIFYDNISRNSKGRVTTKGRGWKLACAVTGLGGAELQRVDRKPTMDDGLSIFKICSRTAIRRFDTCAAKNFRAPMGLLVYPNHARFLYLRVLLSKLT